MENIREYAKRFVAMAMAIIMVMTSFPVQSFAQSPKAKDKPVNYDNIPIKNERRLNDEKLPVVSAKLGENEKAADFLKNPDQPKIYTLRTDYRVEQGEKFNIGYQPYVATVGEAATAEEQAKVNKKITMPDLAGYTTPRPGSFVNNYADIKKQAEDDGLKRGNDENGLQYRARRDFKYRAKSSSVTVKHVFQDLKNFEKYTNPDGSEGEEGARYTVQNGSTGSTLEIKHLDASEIKGFIPEADFLKTQVPESGTFTMEYRYNRARFGINYDSAGGTPLPSRTLYYQQTVPQIAPEYIPTKVGGEFQGWKPSIELKARVNGVEKIFEKDKIIKDKDGNAIIDLHHLIFEKDESGNIAYDAEGKPKTKKSSETFELTMPASNITFTAEWKDKPKADYAIQFWAEKADHAEGASLLEKYDYMGTKVFKQKDTGSRPDLDSVSIKNIVFPDLDQARLNKIWNGDKFNQGMSLYLNKFFVFNKKLTAEENKDKDKPTLVKSVSSTGKTVYNIYYDRQVYDLYFTKSNYFENKSPTETFYPSIYKSDGNGGSKKVGGPGDPYHFKARFNQLMMGWPNDAMQTKGFTPGWQSYGWGPNYLVPEWPTHLDTPPYRLNADEFLDMAAYENLGGYAKKIDKGDGTSIDLPPEDFRTLSLGIKQGENSIPHHMDFWMDGFKTGETIVRYDLYRSKADTNDPDYGHKAPKVQGFKAKREAERTEFIGYYDVDAKNDEREAETPFPEKTYKNMYNFKYKIGEMYFINAFFNNANEYGDPINDGDPFEKNGYLRFKYYRNKYPLRFNYDPSKTKGDDEFNSTNQLDTFYEFPLKVLSPDLVKDTTKRDDREYFKKNPENFLDDPDNLYKLGLHDLLQRDKTDPSQFAKDAKGHYILKRPDGLSDQMVFKGWALDPAGTKLVWENKGEKMPSHALNLYAKWDDPDYHWTVTYDPNGGNLYPLEEKDITKTQKTVKEGDKGKEEVNTYPKKEASQDNKQIFTVIQKQKLKAPESPTRKGYDFMGWEVIRYKKDPKTGDYTNEIDDSYRKTYGVPELYSFGNDVVSPITLKAIWVKNEKLDVDVRHYFLDKDFKLDKTLKDRKNPLPEVLEDKRVGYYVATTGDKQDEEWILAPHEELEAKLQGDLKTEYEEYSERTGLQNTFFQTLRVEPAQVKNDAGKMVDNTNNVFKFFYRRFRTRNYKVNYVDVRAKDAIEKATDPEAKKALIEANKVVTQEAVVSRCRYYDARNYRPIPGWKLVGDPQQQLFYDVDEETNELIGINGTKSDEITFYYQDARVIEVKDKDDPVPNGYVRLTYKADKGGAFTDKDGNKVTELSYDVIKGLKSDMLPVPKELKDGEEKEAGKYYITPEAGKNFLKWDEKPLLNSNTLLENETPGFYTFTAKFEWSGLTASGLVRTEAFKDPSDKWNNDFAPTIEQLKKQLVWREKDQVKPIPAGTKIQFFDEAGNELKTDGQVYDLVQEMSKADKDELVRTVNIKAKVTFKDGKEAQELDIPITVYKNRYEALNENGHKPLFLKEAEAKDAKDGGLKDILKDTTSKEYVRVTVAPTGDMKSKNNKVYYVNPKAWVDIPEVKAEGSSNFINWTADQVKQNEDGKKDGKFDFAKRHKFTEDTVISPVGVGDVVEQKEGEDKPNVPESYVKVIVKTTDKATTETAFEKTFWVDPTKEVSLTLPEPIGKEKQKVNLPNLGEREVTYTFNKQWQKVKAGEADDKLTEVKPAENVDLTRARFTDNVTVIEAVYKLSIASEKIVEPLKPNKLDIPKGKTIEDKELIEKITPQAGKEIDSITVIEKPDGNTVGDKQEAKVIVKYKDGTTQGTNDNPVVIPVEVHENIVPSYDGSKPKDPFMANYVKITFKAGEGGTISDDGKKAYYVSPEVEADMTAIAEAITKTAKTGYINGTWDISDSKKLKDTFKTDTEFTFNFTKSDNFIEGKPGVEKPKGYVTVKFIAGEHGSIVDGDKTYFVNPDANVKLVDTATAGAKDELVIPATKADDNYAFEKWVEPIDYTKPIKGDQEHVAKFEKNNVTLTYDAGEGTGTVPEKQTAAFGGKVRLANADGLSKENYVFDGWKIGDTTYQAGQEVTLNGNATAIAQWKPVTHKVDFNTMGGSNVASQEVEHGKTATQPKAPKLDGKVFMGWKENTSDTSYFNFSTPITADKTLIAIWQDAVQKIKETDPVEDQFIKVTFKQGAHGQLAGGEVTYKVAKGYDLTQAKEKGLVVPEIQPNKYYKAQDANTGWDKALDLTLGEGQKEKVFTAQYAPEADLIPIDPKVTNPEIIKNEKPEGMVLVQFVVDDAKAFMVATSKFYVAPNKEVTITPPTVYNRPGQDKFDGWQKVNLDDKGLLKGTYTEDTSILANGLALTEMEIVVPQAGFDFVEAKKGSLESGATGHLEIVRGGQKYMADVAQEYVTEKKIGRRTIKQVKFGFKVPAGVGMLQSGDLIRHWAENDTMKSNIKEITIK